MGKYAELVYVSGMDLKLWIRNKRFVKSIKFDRILQEEFDDVMSHFSPEKIDLTGSIELVNIDCLKGKSVRTLLMPFLPLSWKFRVTFHMIPDSVLYLDTGLSVCVSINPDHVFEKVTGRVSNCFPCIEAVFTTYGNFEPIYPCLRVIEMEMTELDFEVYHGTNVDTMIVKADRFKGEIPPQLINLSFNPIGSVKELLFASNVLFFCFSGRIWEDKKKRWFRTTDEEINKLLDNGLIRYNSFGNKNNWLKHASLVQLL